MYEAAKHLQRQLNPNCFTSFGSKENIQADFLNSRPICFTNLTYFLKHYINEWYTVLQCHVKQKMSNN